MYGRLLSIPDWGLASVSGLNQCRDHVMLDRPEHAQNIIHIINSFIPEEKYT